MSFIAAGIGAAVSIGGSIFGASRAKKAERRAAEEKRALQAEFKAAEASRQDVINPYADVTSLADMIVDNTGLLSNAYANIGVATQAAEFQAEEADIALANTLDTLMATGASAGGATALAQAALQSKRGVSASIEQQEADNQKLAARGEQFLQQQKLAEAQRVQGSLMGEAARMQETDVLGKEFVYGETERRETEQLNRLQAQITGQQQAEMQARSDGAAAISAGISAVGNIGAAAASRPVE
tara:strand:- start:1303 stop:2028 length:726 start_codon:yes stop_codon:yes gene_type:complete